MADEFLGDRRRALEDSFFAKENAKKLGELRAAEEAKSTREALSQASGITDPEVLDELRRLGFRAETLAALSLYPLVAVAWADRSIKSTERRAVLDAAHAAGIQRGDVAHDLLESWLNKRPGDDLLKAWRDMVGALKEQLGEKALASIRDDLLSRAKGVAKAAGGVLGLGSKVSDAERKVLDDLKDAFA
jgi:hypothetical protein